MEPWRCIHQSFGCCWLEGDGDRGDGGMGSQRTQVGDAFDNVLTHLARRYVCAGEGGWGRRDGGCGRGWRTLFLWLVCFFTDIHYSCSSSRHSLRSLPKPSFVLPTAAASAWLHQPWGSMSLAESARHGKPKRCAIKKCALVPVFPPQPTHAKMENNFERSR